MRHGIHSFFLLKPGEDGVKRHRAGRILVHDAGLHVLEDYHGSMIRNAVPATDPGAAAAGIAGLRRSPYVEMTQHDDWLGDKLPSDVREEELPPMQPDQTPTAPGRPPSVWEYFRTGMDRPHVVEARGREVTLDGAKLSEEETQRIFENAAAGAATLRYRTPPAPPPAAAPMVKSEHPKGTSDTILKDPMCPRLGNLLALEKRKPKEGEVAIAMDLNNFWRVNEANWQTGDETMIAFGELVATGAGSAAYRVGGDAFLVFKPSWPEAWTFIRDFLDREKELPLVGGNFRLTCAIGLGPDEPQAWDAMRTAKQQKYRESSEQPSDVVYTMGGPNL